MPTKGYIFNQALSAQNFRDLEKNIDRTVEVAEKRKRLALMIFVASLLILLMIGFLPGGAPNRGAANGGPELLAIMSTSLVGFGIVFCLVPSFDRDGNRMYE